MLTGLSLADFSRALFSREKSWHRRGTAGTARNSQQPLPPPHPPPPPAVSSQLLIGACPWDCGGRYVPWESMVRRPVGAPADSGSPREKGCELTWFLGNRGPSAGAGAGGHHLLSLHHVPVLAGPAIMLGLPSGCPGAAGCLDAQGLGQLWCPLGGSAGQVVPTPAGHLVLLQVHEPGLSLQALLATALLSLQGQTPVAPIRDPEVAGGRPVFAESTGWRWEVGTQHGAASP